MGTGEVVSLSVSDELGALVLKVAAYSVDRRDCDRHLMDAAVLAACISDHAAELEQLGGSDRQRRKSLRWKGFRVARDGIELSTFRFSVGLVTVPVHLHA
jgi:hypothetical protein